MTTNPFSSPAPSGSYRSFRDDAVAQWADRRGHKVLNRRKRNAVLAALALAGTVFSATTAASLLTSEAATPPAQSASCVAAGQRLAPWFRAETDRKAQVGLDERDDFNLLLTWFRNAQAQCASGQTARAVENFKAVERMIAERVEQHQPEDEDE
jgi:uncharacterized protein YfiM (DUF2279 family)